MHVFRRREGSWRRDGVLVPPELGGDACACLTSSPAGRGPCSTARRRFRNFGRSVAVNQDLALVGAIKGDGGSNDGAVYVFRSEGSCWRHQLTIRVESTVGFGRTVALHEGSALVRTQEPGHGVYLFRIREAAR